MTTNDSKDAVTREQIDAWAKLAGINVWTDRDFERLGDFAIFARRDALANRAPDLSRDEASVAQELRAGIAKEIEAQYELGAWNALEIAWSAIGELPDDLFCVSGKAAIRDAIKAIQEQYKS